MLKKDANI